ncbi:MAG: fumarylacetoacetate hydrolase family protein [Gemmatimonadota bacterium]|nr:MAG: fumarylacetoacetate hydrolase family protein [Gemmatimonadota bacterium]
MAEPAWAQTDVTKYVRYSVRDRISYGVLEDEVIWELAGDLFQSPRTTGRTVPLTGVELLAPCEPSKVIAVGLNYQSHLGEREPAEHPGLFAKYPTSIVGHGADIVMPPDATDLHYEGELVIVIGREAKNVPLAEAGTYVFGVTAGNDVSERAWQRGDLQWLRAKASDTFGPIGPVIVTGLDHNNLLVQTRVNGEVRQSERSSDLIFDVETIVSYVSRYVTLMPGDVIFTGTPGSTRAMAPGDVVEVEVEGVGVLRNTVVAQRAR